MADYNLGKAHGTIDIDYKGKGPKDATRDMDELGNASERSSRRVTSAADEQSSAYDQLGGAARRLAADVERLAVAEITARARLRAAEEELNRARAEGAGAADRVRAAERELSAAQERAVAAATRLRTSQEALANVRDRLSRQPPLDAGVQVNHSTFNSLVQHLRNIDNQTRRTQGILNTFRSRLAVMIGSAALASPSIVGLAVSLMGLAGAAGVALGALAALAAVGGTIATGFSGVGEVFKAAGKQAAGAGASAAASAAQQRAAARQIEQAIRGVRDAQENLIRTQADAVRSARDASRQIVSAERALRDAQFDSIRAQQDLSRARRDATRQLEDMHSALRGGALDERQAIIDLEQAQLDLNETLADPRSTDLDRRQAILTLEKQEHQLEQIRTANSRLGVDQTEAAAKGVAGAESVVDAQNNVLRSQHQLEQAQFDLTEAVANAAQNQIDSQIAIRDAVEAVADAHRDLEEAYLSASEAGSAGASAVADAMANVSPEVREFVKAVMGQRDAWQAVKFAVQDSLFEGLAEQVAPLAERYFPLLEKGMSGIAREMNRAAKDAASFFMQTSTSSDVASIFESTRGAVRELNPALQDLLAIFFDISTVGASLLPELSGGFANWTAQLRETIAASRESGALAQWMRDGIETAKQLGRILANIGSIVGTIFSAFDTAGGGFLDTLEMATDKLDKFLKTAEGQALLRALAQTFDALAKAIVNLVISGLEILGPVFVKLAPLLQQFFTLVSQYLVAALQALQPLLMGVASVLSFLGPGIVPVIAGIYAMNKAVAAATGVWKALNLMMKANPFVLVIAAVIALALLIIENWDAIKAFLETCWEAIKSAAQFLWNGIKASIIEPVQSAIDTIVGVWNTFAGWIEDKWNGLVALAQTIWRLFMDNIVNPIRDGIRNVVQLFSELPRKVIDALGDAGSWLLDVGKNIIEGLWRGIENAAQWIWDKIRNLANQVADAFSSALDIFSPSKVFMEFGQFTLEGYIVGLDNMEKNVLHRVVSIASDVAAAGQPPMPTIPPGAIPRPRGGDGAEMPTQATTINVENLHLNVAGNLDPSNPTQFRKTVTAIRDGIRTVEREER